MTMAKAADFNVLAKYDNYVIANASTVTSVESTLRTLTYLIPGRFQDAELASEALSSFLNLLGIYHDTILARAIDKLEKKPLLSVHNRYTKFWTSSSAIYKNVSTFVTVLQQCSFLLEILARRKFGNKGKWRLVIAIEALKAVCRTLLLRETKSRILVYPHIPEREIDPTKLEETLDRAQIPALPLEKAITFESHDQVTDFLMKQVLYPDRLKSPKSLLHTVHGPAKVAELLFIFRPLVYAVLLSRSDKSNWRPWLIGLALDYASRELYMTSFQRSHVGGLRALTKLEKSEHQKRGYYLLWWFLRGAFYENYTRPKITSITDRLERVPVVGLLATVVRDYEYWWDSYFTTATI